ncbi:MAG: hypothetical protein PHP56_12495, partial [Smithellaceae bacterium]|nr:hypothetical protein [Smithellaceae bacterium]
FQEELSKEVLDHTLEITNSFSIPVRTLVRIGDPGWKRFLEHIPKREPMITKTGTRRLAPVFVIAALFWDQKRSQWNKGELRKKKDAKKTMWQFAAATWS